MAIDMTTVKQIMHNNKEVVKIEDGLGNILWQKASPVTTITITLTNPVSFSLTNRGDSAGANGWVTISQLTEKIAATADLQDADLFYILPAATVQAIKNHTYTTSQTISSLSFTEWRTSYRGTAYVCYIQNNDLYCVGNLDNSTANDTVLGTTNDLTKFRAYYPNRYLSYYDWVAVNNSTDTGTVAIKWRFSNANYLINHTNTFNTSNKNRVQTYTWTDQTGTLTYTL